MGSESNFIVSMRASAPYCRLGTTLEKRGDLFAEFFRSERPAAVCRITDCTECRVIQRSIEERSIRRLPRGRITAERVVRVVATEDRIAYAKRIGAVT